MVATAAEAVADKGPHGSSLAVGGFALRHPRSTDRALVDSKVDLETVSLNNCGIDGVLVWDYCCNTSEFAGQSPPCKWLPASSRGDSRN